MDIPTFKTVIIGEEGVGKTTFIHRHMTGDFLRDHIQARGDEIVSLVEKTNYGPICFNICDPRGQDRIECLRSGYYTGAQCAIVMFDSTNPRSYQHLVDWKKDLTDVCGHIPIVIAGNKCDQDRKVLEQRFEDRPIVYLSAKNNKHFELPFVYLARALLNHFDLELVENPPMCPTEIVLPRTEVLSRTRTIDLEYHY